jgi:hypothetical protein
MSRFIDLIQENNAAGFKQLFEETLADKVITALDEKKIALSKNLGSVKRNPYRDNKSALQRDSRGFIGMGDKSVSHKGGLGNPKI